jgi:tRNA threonylcarbamoyladenosine biosynthesis protein TsaB
MRILTIETSTPVAEAAVVVDEKVIAATRLATGRERGRELLVAVHEVLAEASCGVSDIDVVAVSIGPGRFSGLRVGLATAKGLAVAHGIPVSPVPTLEALARSAGPYDGVICPMLDARRGEVYFAVYDSRAGLECLERDSAAAPDAAAARARDAASGDPVLFLGTGAVEYAAQIRDLLGASAVFQSEDLALPKPDAMAVMVEGPRRTDRIDLARLEPIYLRGI